MSCKKRVRNVFVNFVCSFIFTLTWCTGVATAAGHFYKPHDPVFIIANKVGPFNNPSETYEVRLSIFMAIC